MRWHRLLIAAGITALAVPLAATAQQAKEPARVSVLSPQHASEPSREQREPFEQGLRELGWMPGSSILVEYHYADGRIERLPEQGGTSLKPVATINNVPVYSNKRMTGIVNTRVQFADGSWANVSTGQTYNAGEGFISVGSMPSGIDTKPVTVGPKEFHGNHLTIADLDADLDVQPGGDKIVVTVTGPKSGVDAIVAGQMPGRVLIQGRPNAGKGGDSRGKVVITGRGGSISVGGSISMSNISAGGISISRGGEESDVKLTVQVPVGTTLDISGVTGTTNVGNTEGPLSFTQQGSGKATIGEVGATQLRAQGQGNIRVREVKDLLTANVMGQADIRVDGGKVATLQVSVMGQGEFDFRGEATNANLTVMGQGEINTSHVTNQPSRSVMGQGEINVGNW
jgi:hypothetical protein